MQPEFQCPLPLGSASVYCRSYIAHCPQAVWQCAAGFPLPTAPRQCGSEKQEVPCFLPQGYNAACSRRPTVHCLRATHHTTPHHNLPLNTPHTTPNHTTPHHARLGHATPYKSSVQKEPHCPCAGFLNAQPRPIGKKACARKNFAQVEQQVVPRATLDRRRPTPKRVTALCHTCTTHYT